MKIHRSFEIAFVGLKNGVHEFQYSIEDRFFSGFAQPDFTETRLNIKLIFDKKPSFFLLKFEITGYVTVSCDRCGKAFPLAIWDEFDQVIKLVEKPEEFKEDESPDVCYISRTESRLNVAGWIYEFILLSVPMQRIHPEKTEEGSGCDPVVLKMLDKMQGNENRSDKTIWKDLDKFR
ncbi:MAG TPA: DUF177 domain-containing protein [Chitinophagaceae bacterium]|nr:DUF177 domain-containing protein [Chitinophagaceae bacterium]